MTIARITTLLLTALLAAGCGTGGTGGNSGGTASNGGTGGGNQTTTNDALLEELKALRQEVRGLSDDVAELKKAPAPLRQAEAPRQDEPPRPTTAQVPVPTAGYPAKGNKSAPVTIVEFSDFQCPFCARHTQNTVPRIEANYVNTGKVRYVFMDNPIPSHRFAAKAAEAAHCAGEQGRYWEMHNAMFGAQQRIMPGNFPVFAEEIGIDRAAFEQCLDSGRHQARVETAARLASEVGARATPTFVIGRTEANGQVRGELVVGAKSYDAFAAVFDRLLGK
ncbi:MAG: thioredoxin domain-containing protein [Nitrospirae bacterium]|nr:thioredoxin domain-containing protein [Nitrospirota bacterium]